jgi:DNA-binding NarL/FixJ family response regulator
MRAILVGPRAGRERVRVELEETAIEIAAEFDTLAEARAAASDEDAIILAPDARDEDEGGEPIAEPLTPREIQVLEFLAEGRPNKGIAEALRISDQTVKFHVASILGKLGAANRTEAVRIAVRRGLLAL